MLAWHLDIQNILLINVLYAIYSLCHIYTGKIVVIFLQVTVCRFYIINKKNSSYEVYCHIYVHYHNLTLYLHIVLQWYFCSCIAYFMVSVISNLESKFLINICFCPFFMVIWKILFLSYTSGKVSFHIVGMFLSWMKYCIILGYWTKVTWNSKIQYLITP